MSRLATTENWGGNSASGLSAIDLTGHLIAHGDDRGSTSLLNAPIYSELKALQTNPAITSERIATAFAVVLTATSAHAVTNVDYSTATKNPTSAIEWQQVSIIEEAIAEMEAYGRLSDGWDGPWSLAPTPVVIRSAVAFLKGLAGVQMVEPEAIVSEDGTAGWSWRTDKGVASITFYPDGQYGYFARCDDSTAKIAKGAERALDVAPTDFRDCLQAMS